MTEHKHQVQLFLWAWVNRQKYPLLQLMYAIPNGEKRSMSVGKRLKAEGVKPGVPDIFLPVARGGYHGLYIEMKRPKQGKARPGRMRKEQLDWVDSLTGQGYLAVVCYGWGPAADLLKTYIIDKTGETK